MSLTERWGEGTRSLLAAGAVVLVAVPIVAHAMHDRRVELEQVARLEEVVKNLQPLAQRAVDGRRVVINGDPIFFRMQTSTEPLAKALDGVTLDCQSGDADRMLGLPSAFERSPHTKRLELTKVLRENGDGAAATLCIFHASDDHSEGTAQIRYTLAHENDDHRVSLFTVSTEAASDAYATFPVEGDARGGDFTAIPRPRGAKRLFVATIEGESYAVRIYEAQGSVAAMVQQYDADMALAGWTRSEAVAKEMPNARLYIRGDDRFVASFEGVDGVARVSIAPFQR